MISNAAIAKQWSDETVARVSVMLRDGWTARQIATEIGVTRNAVIGKIRRVKALAEIGLQGKPGWKTVHKVVAAERAKVVRMPAAPKRRVLPTVTLPAPVPRMLTLVELETADCRWPYGDPREDGFGYCAHQRHAGFRYCPYHARVAYQAVAERQEQARAAA